MLRVMRAFGSRRFCSWRTKLEPLAKKAGSIRGTVGIPSTDDDASSNKKPLVILSGWALAKRKHLHKYSDLYNSLGYPTLCLAPSLPRSMKLSSSDKYCNEITQILENSYSGPIVFHLFSISSSILLPYFTGVVANLKNIQLKGVIFDSGPVLFSYKTGVAAARRVMEEGGMSKLVFYTLITFGFVTEALKGPNAREELSVALKRQALAVPQLYLYSDRDPVTPLDWVEKVMGEQRGLGRPVEGVMFQRSSHVKLLQSEPVKYTNLVTSFLNNISIAQ